MCTLPIEFPSCSVRSVGRTDEGGDPSVTGGGIAALDPFVYRDMRWCAKCGREEQFCEMLEGSAGRGGVCLGCGDERVVAFGRETGVLA